MFTAFAVVCADPNDPGRLRWHAYRGDASLDTALDVSPGCFAWTAPGPADTRYLSEFTPARWIETGTQATAEDSVVFRVELRRTAPTSITTQR